MKKQGLLEQIQSYLILWCIGRLSVFSYPLDELGSSAAVPHLLYSSLQKCHKQCKKDKCSRKEKKVKREGEEEGEACLNYAYSLKYFFYTDQ